MPNLKKSDCIYLNITGFNIRLKFGRSELLYLKNKLKAAIFDFYRHFIEYKRPRRIDFTISFMEEKVKNIGFKKIIKPETVEYYLKVFEEVGRKKARATYSINLIQVELIIRKIFQRLLVGKKGFMLHSSASDIGEKALLFLGPSRGGKTTIINLLKDAFSPLTDDTAIIKKEENTFYFYQGPFFEKEQSPNRNKLKYPIAGVFFLKKAPSFKIKKIENKAYIFEKLVRQLLLDKAQLKAQTGSLLDFIYKSDNFYYLYFNKDGDNLIRHIKSYIKLLASDCRKIT